MSSMTYCCVSCGTLLAVVLWRSKFREEQSASIHLRMSYDGHELAHSKHDCISEIE